MESLWLLKIFSSCNLLFIWFVIVFFFKGIIIHVLAFSVLPLSFVIKKCRLLFLAMLLNDGLPLLQARKHSHVWKECHFHREIAA